MSDRRMIEQQIPLEAVNFHSAKEKKHPRRHVELVHQWPARRPRSASRVAIAAALLRAPEDPEQFAERLQLLEDLAPYECNPSALQRAREMIRADHGGRAPRVLDLFAGGGAIPLEAANLGCESHAIELNPVAHIIELATCVYPQKFRTKLAPLVKEWGEWVLREVKEQIGGLYPAIPVDLKTRNTSSLALAFEGRVSETAEVLPLAYLWTRTVPCSNPSCGATVPLVRQTWLCRKKDRSIALRMHPNRKTLRVDFELASASSPAGLGFDPADHSDRGDATCPFCSSTIEADKVKEHGKAGCIGQQLMAVVGTLDGERGRVYLPASAVHLPDEATLLDKLKETGEEWPGMTRIPLPKDARNFWAYLYGCDTFDRLFTLRQTVALLTFAQKIKEASARLKAREEDQELVKAVVTYLALALDKLAENMNSICRWEPNDQRTKSAMSRQALPMVWDFAEINPTAWISGCFEMQIESETNSVAALGGVASPVQCIRSSAAKLPYTEQAGGGKFDAIITDPPYYDNISYADLSDFYYVWLKRSLQEHYPAHLSGDQTPKRQEITVVPHRHEGDDHTARRFYVEQMAKALAEGGRVLKPGGPMVVVYAHKTVAGWATLVDAMRNADCCLTEAWPLKTESDARLNAQGTAALATSIFLVGRKREAGPSEADYDEEVLPEVEQVIAERAAALWKAGLTGADLIIALIGAALGPFTRYKQVFRANGDEVSTGEFLEHAQRKALEAALKQVVKDATGKDVSISGIDPTSRLYVAIRLQVGEAATDFDTIKNLAIGALPRGTELDGIKGALMKGKRALLSKSGSKVSLRTFEERGADPDLGLSDLGGAAPLIDVLHRLLWLQRNRPAEIGAFLQQSKADLNQVKLLAQALGGKPLRAEPRPGAQRDERTSEQRAIDTLLASFENVTRKATDGPLFEERS
jgi:putative DNA methylase